MAPRLLSLLTAIENALTQRGSNVMQTPAQRSVSFHKGIARMVFSGNVGSILLQSFTLADGQTCVKAELFWNGSSTVGQHSVYPREVFDWESAADQIAAAWIAGPVSDASATVQAQVEPLAATG